MFQCKYFRSAFIILYLRPQDFGMNFGGSRCNTFNIEVMCELQMKTNQNALQPFYIKSPPLHLAFLNENVVLYFTS